MKAPEPAPNPRTAVAAHQSHGRSLVLQSHCHPSRQTTYWHGLPRRGRPGPQASREHPAVLGPWYRPTPPCQPGRLPQGGPRSHRWPQCIGMSHHLARPGRGRGSTWTGGRPPAKPCGVRPLPAPRSPASHACPAMAWRESLALRAACPSWSGTSPGPEIRSSAPGTRPATASCGSLRRCR